MQIYWFKAQAPLRVLALAKHLGIEAETIEVDLMGGGLRTDAYTALRAHAKAPTRPKRCTDSRRRSKRNCATSRSLPAAA
jgi:hypothetical protein